jgi:hypothetical protein
MRFVEYTALARMDGFAALDAAPFSGPGIGGFRFIPAKRAERTGLGGLIARRLAHWRLRVTGSLAVLFVGSLTLAVIAGPASCPCGVRPAPSTAAASDTNDISRFGYTRVTAAEIPQIPELTAVIAPAHAAGTSPISTSALPPARGASARLALPTTIEPLADVRPIQLAAAGGADELIPMLPMVEIVTPDAPAPEAKSEIRRDRATPARHKTNTLRARRAKSGLTPSSGAPKKAPRAPRWAQQMFETPWQSKAFSYIR